MIKRLEISGVHLKVSEDLRKYVAKKIGRLDRYMPIHARKSVHAEVILKETSGKPTKFESEVILHLPSGTLTAKDTTINIFAAVDIVEAKLRSQLKHYKAKHASHTSRGDRLVRIIRRRPVE